MTPAHFIPWPNWILLGLNLIAEISVLWISMRRSTWKFLAMLPGFALFSLAADVAGTVMLFTVQATATPGHLWHSTAYWIFYWSIQIGASVIVLLLALQIVSLVLPPWKALITLLALILFASMAGVMVHLLPSRSVGDVLAALTIADVIAILALPMIWLVRPAEWPKGIGTVVAGLILSTLLQVGCALGAAALHTLVGVFTLGIPAASLVGMCFFLAGIRSLPQYSAVKGEMGKLLPLSFLATIQNQRRIFAALRRAHDPGAMTRAGVDYSSIGQRL